MAIWVRNEKAFVKNSSSFSPLSLLSSFTGGVRMTHNPIAKEKFKYGKVKITPKPYHSPPSWLKWKRKKKAPSKPEGCLLSDKILIGNQNKPSYLVTKRYNPSHKKK